MQSRKMKGSISIAPLFSLHDNHSLHERTGKRNSELREEAASLDRPGKVRLLTSALLFRSVDRVLLQPSRVFQPACPCL